MSKAIFIQARLSSKRFPGKMLKDIYGGMPLIEFVYRRCSKIKSVDLCVVLTSNDPSDDELASYCNSKNIEFYRGPLNNVLERFIEASEFFKIDEICRVCGDSPFIDTNMIEDLFKIREEQSLDYVAPLKEICIAGFDSEVFLSKALKRSSFNCISETELEHVTTNLKNNTSLFKIEFVERNLMPDKLKNVSLTIDFPDDLLLAQKIVNSFGRGNFDFISQDILDYLLLRKANG